MLTGRANGANPIHRLRQEVDQAFNNLFGEVTGWPTQGLSRMQAFPALNVWEDDARLYVEAELPGLAMDKLDLTVVGNELTLRGEREGHDGEGVIYHRRERGTGGFSRVLRLPTEVDAERVEASLHNGVLLITLPKAEAARPRKIEVKAS